MFLRSIRFDRESYPTTEKFPFNIKAIQQTARIDLCTPVTFFVGENGSGKSALLDAIARKSGFLPWGGSKVHRYHANPHETRLANHISLGFGPRHPYGFHFRAEAFFNFAGSLDDILLDDPGRDKYFGGGSLHMLSHGESFLAFFQGYSFQLDGLYLLDEPEAALSPKNQVEFVRILLEAVSGGARQYLIATHSPILLGCPGSTILSFDNGPIRPTTYEETPHYSLYKHYLEDPMRFLNVASEEKRVVPCAPQRSDRSRG
ncbi:MAG: AAA family ATPase [Thermodesulfobacteriota bacterium]